VHLGILVTLEQHGPLWQGGINASKEAAGGQARIGGLSPGSAAPTRHHLPPEGPSSRRTDQRIGPRVRVGTILEEGEGLSGPLGRKGPCKRAIKKARQGGDDANVVSDTGVPCTLPLEVYMGEHYHIFWNEELNGTNEGWCLRKGQHDG